LADPDAVIERLLAFFFDGASVLFMREADPWRLPREVIELLPILSLIASTGSGNASTSMSAAASEL